MPTFGDITNIISTSVEKKDVNTYQAITWYEKAKTHYENAFRITEIEGLLIIEQKAKNKSEDSMQVYINGELVRELFVNNVHKPMMDFMVMQYLNTNLPDLGDTANYEDVKEVELNGDTFVVNPFA
jgi:hypothetical protein